MPYGQGEATHSSRGHARGLPDKGSGESMNSRSAKPPSQKAMLSRALQRANVAVQLDNAQNFEGARLSYSEACDLLHQVLQRTSAQEDKRKLEAIRRTYTSRIDELNQMLPWQTANNESKPLPTFANSHEHRSESALRTNNPQSDDQAAFAETMTAHRIVRDHSRSPQPPGLASPWQRDAWAQRQNVPEALRSANVLQAPEPGFLQSAFSRSPVRSKFNEQTLPVIMNDENATNHASRVAWSTPPTVHADGLTDPQATDPREGRRKAPDHRRDESQNSWLDPIDESGGSTASSVHSRTSSMGYRRRPIRPASGDTEAEFDTALDAAIEAAYDDGYEPMENEELDLQSADEEIVANAMRKVELARERVRQTQREAYAVASEKERQRWFQQPQSSGQVDRDLGRGAEDFFDDNSSDEEERILEEMTGGFEAEGGYQFQQKRMRRPSASVPFGSESNGSTSHPGYDSTGLKWTNAPASLPAVNGTRAIPSPPRGPAPAVPAPTHALPELPPSVSTAPSVRNRRLSGQNPKQLKIQTKILNTPSPQEHEDATIQSKPAIAEELSNVLLANAEPVQRSHQPSLTNLGESPLEPQPLGASFSQRETIDHVEDAPTSRSTSPSTNKIQKKFSSSSLKSRNLSITNLDEVADMSPGTPSSSHWGISRVPAVPAIPSPLAAALKDKAENSSNGGMHLFEGSIHPIGSPGSPGEGLSNGPVPLEPCPVDFMLRPFWLMRCLFQTLVHPRGGYLSSKLFVPREAWHVKGVKLRNVEDKISNCDLLTAALLKLARVDTCDADAVLEEMQSLEAVLEHAQASLSRKLGSEVGVSSTATLFRDAPGNFDGDSSTNLPRSASVSGKSAFSWRRLRPKNSAATLTGTQPNRPSGTEAVKDITSLSTLPMTTQPTSRPTKRDVSQTQFSGPNAQYMSCLARLFDAAQAIDQIARQVDDPGLRHADKTQVGLELCTRHAAEFFGFYVCRFVLSDLGMMMDKFIKRGSEWVLS